MNMHRVLCLQRDPDSWLIIMDMYIFLYVHEQPR